MRTAQGKILSSLNDLKSHPDKLLREHLLKVGSLCQKILFSKRINIDNYIDHKTFQDISYLVGITHDFGKVTAYFQEYINEKDEVKKTVLKNKPETYHSLLSSIFTYYVVKAHLLSKNLQERGYYKYLPIIAFFVVKRHHGDLCNVLDEISIFEDDEQQKILEKQVEAIDWDKVDDIYNPLFSEIGFHFIKCQSLKDKFLNSKPVYIYGQLKEYRKEYVNDLARREKRLIENMGEENTFFYYFVNLFLYSVLLDADKTNAANLEIIKRQDISDDVVDNYKKLRFAEARDGSKINRIRNKIYDETVSKLYDLNLDNDKILSLNVPTGTGKTLTSLSFALKLRERIKKEKGFCPRVIYSLPFLSIIDQNFDVFEDVFKFANGELPASDILLKHHYLSDIGYKSSDEFENIELRENISKSLLLIEGWNSEIIVTTFIQFFYSLISSKNRMIRKFHNIINSIVILDEIQAIPHKYWQLLNKTIKFFAEYFNTYFIFVTATQPLIFNERKGEIKELVENKEYYFRELDRIRLIPNLISMEINEFTKILGEEVEKNPNKNFLIVLNTINSSQKVYAFIKSLNLNSAQIYYLSTNVIPKERLERIKSMRKGNKKRKIIVSTQLIEAGVDIDCDIVYRDFAPLDSINQVAGRCNRNCKSSDEKGLVKIFVLKEGDDKREYYKYIYDNFITSKTEDVLNEIDGDRINESQILGLNNNYFERVNEGKSDDESNKILENVRKLEFDELSEFKLIEENYFKTDIFIELDDKAKEIWRKYIEVKNNNEKLSFFERKEEFLKIKKQFYDYVISVDKKYAGGLLDEEYRIGYVSHDELKSYYDPDTGLKRENAGSGSLIC